jgi:hypothetical protein
MWLFNKKSVMQNKLLEDKFEPSSKVYIELIDEN